MANFDASVLQDVGSNLVPDVAGDTGKALTLADLYDQNTLNKGKIREQQQGQADMTYAKQILAGKDLSKLEDQNAAVAKITQRSPQLGMELMRGFQAQQRGEIDNERSQLELYNAKNDIIGGAMLQLKQKHDQIIQDFKAKNPQATPQQLEQATHDAMKGDVMTTVQSLAQAKLPNGKPLLGPDDAKIIQSGFGQGYSASFVDSAVSRSAQARAAIAQKLKERDEDRKEKATNAAITAGVRKGDQVDRKLTDAEQNAHAKQILDSEGKLEPDDATAMAQQYLAGDKSVLTGLGRGKQGAQNIILVRHAIAKEAQAQGLKPADIAARLAEYQGYTAEQRSLGTRSANIETSSTEAYKMIDIAKKASGEVPRGGFLPWNKLVRGGDVVTQDPQYAKFAAATLAVVNTWARAISPSGVPTVADKEHANAVLNTAQSQEAYEAVLDQFKTEIAAALNAPADVKQALHDRFVGGAGGGGKGTEPTANPTVPLAPSGPPAASPAAPAAAPPGASPAVGGPPKVINWADLPN
jgi:hypothetical protein